MGMRISDNFAQSKKIYSYGGYLLGTKNNPKKEFQNKTIPMFTTNKNQHSKNNLNYFA